MARKLDINTKDTILKAVEELISNEETNSFSLRDVSKKAHISLGTLYYYYKSKDDLILDLYSLYLNTLNNDYFDWLQRHKNDLTPDRFFDVIFYKGVKLFNRGKMHLFLLNECIGGNKQLKEKYRDLYKVWQENLKIGTMQIFPNIKQAETYASLLMMIVDGMIVQQTLNLENNFNEEKIKELLKGLNK